jgi:flavodoxin
MRVLVLYESRRGFTMRVAEAIRDEIRGRGHQATCTAFGRADVGTVTAADALVFGTWIEGMIVVKVRPADDALRAIHGLPDLGGRPVALFCTFDVSPLGAMERLANRVASRGGRVVTSWAFKRYHRRKHRRLAAVPAFVDDALAAFEAAPVEP